jgi:hypothetical protein
MIEELNIEDDVDNQLLTESMHKLAIEKELINQINNARTNIFNSNYGNSTIGGNNNHIIFSNYDK